MSASSAHRSVDRPFDWSLLARNPGVDGSAPPLPLDQEPFGWTSAWFAKNLENAALPNEDKILAAALATLG